MLVRNVFPDNSECSLTCFHMPTGTGKKGCTPSSYVRHWHQLHPFLVTLKFALYEARTLVVNM